MPYYPSVCHHHCTTAGILIESRCQSPDQDKDPNHGFVTEIVGEGQYCAIFLFSKFNKSPLKISQLNPGPTYGHVSVFSHFHVNQKMRL